jgi:uncharacterized membrane protein
MWQLQRARDRMRRKSSSHTTRNVLLAVTATGAVVAALPRVRNRVLDAVSGIRSGALPAFPLGGRGDRGTLVEEIEVDVPVRVAYNQWTQFEEFPKFMDGVDEVKQLDDTLLHWAVTVAGDRAEWDAKITEQEPDRRIAWESIDGKQNRGSVSFEPLSAGSRTRIRLQMTFSPEGVAETVGTSIGLAQRRVSGDLERFRELLERRQHEDGAWRGEIHNGQTNTTDSHQAAAKSTSAGTKPS